MAFESAFAQAFLYLAAALVAILVGKRLGLGAAPTLARSPAGAG